MPTKIRCTECPAEAPWTTATTTRTFGPYVSHATRVPPELATKGWTLVDGVGIGPDDDVVGGRCPRHSPA